MQAAVAHQSEEKKKAAAAPATQPLGVDAQAAEEPAGAGVPLYLHREALGTGNAGGDDSGTTPHAPQGGNGAGNLLSARIQQASFGGRSLEAATRAGFERSYGTSLAGVRIHTGAEADTLARDLDAAAFTVGQHVFFRDGAYDPEGSGGRHLLGHELAHTVQQRGVTGAFSPALQSTVVSMPADPLEREADAAAEVATEGKSLRGGIRQVSTLTVSRSCCAACSKGLPCQSCSKPKAGSARVPDEESVRLVQRYSWDEFKSDVGGAAEAAYETGADVVSAGLEAGEAGVELAGEAVGAAGEALEAAGEAVGEAAEAAYETAAEAGEAIYETGVAAVETAGEAIDWLATEAGQAAKALARALGGVITITRAGLEIRVPRICPLDAIPYTFDLGALEKEFMVPVFALPLGPNVAAVGEIGIVGRLQPLAQIQIGPFCLNGVRILVNPFTGTYSISGSVSATAAASLGAEVRGGLRGALSLEIVVPIGGVPVPISVPVVGVEGGIAGLVRGIGAGTLTMGGGLSIGGGTISLSQTRQLDLGLAGDLFLGAYAQLDIGGENVCRIYWQPLEWHGDIAGSLGISVNLTVTPGGRPSIALSVPPPTFSQIPFSQIPLVLSRDGFSDDCSIKDRICQVLEALGLLPSQNGGSWGWSGPYGPGARLAGPLDVYEKNPGIPSGSECRGACGPNCDTCDSTPVYRYTDPATGDIWEYTNFQDCDSNGGCREHDAAFDWAADVHGETGRWAIVMPWHMAANIECTCNNLAGNCIAWIAGLPPYDSKMYFADTARLVTSGGGSGHPSGSCHADYPNAPDCIASYPDRDTVLNEWGLRNGIGNFGDCSVAMGGTAASLAGCAGAPGNLWYCRATDLGTGQDVTLGILECICCNDDDTSSSEWLEPQIVVQGDMSEELILELCERGLIPRVICIPIEEDMIARFGNRRRDININPDEDPEARVRPDDAPIMASFRRIYNRLDSWSMYIRTNHPEWYPEFESRFHVEESRARWIADLKERTKRFKTEFRNLRETDTEQLRRDYENYVLGDIQREIEQRIRDIAAWYRDKTGSTESIDEIIERIHAEGTELWRAAWRRAILQVNRVLARLWPPAKTRILVWVGQQRARFPHIDLTGTVGELDYIGSLATGYKGPPKQQIRFNPDNFDVDANLAAPPLAKYAIAIDGVRPDRQRIFGRTTTITPLNEFSDQTHTELTARVQGYNSSDPFDVAIDSAELPEQERERRATERLYQLREALDETTYRQMLEELRSNGFLVPDGSAVRGDLTDAQFDEMNAIMDRYAP